MPDREKVKKGLECCLTLDSHCGDCPYYSYEDIQELDCERNLRHDALAMLKKQEPVKPKKAYSTSSLTWWNVCGACKVAINPNDKYCHQCGVPFDWT